jgi:hypothetical protein
LDNERSDKLQVAHGVRFTDVFNGVKIRKNLQVVVELETTSSSDDSDNSDDSDDSDDSNGSDVSSVVEVRREKDWGERKTKEKSKESGQG